MKTLKDGARGIFNDFSSVKIENLVLWIFFLTMLFLDFPTYYI